MSQILKKIATVFSNFQVTPESIDLWTDIFKEYDYLTVEKAALRTIEVCQYSPKPVDLKSAITYIQATNPKKTYVSLSLEEKQTYKNHLLKKGLKTLPSGEITKTSDVYNNEKKIDYVTRILGSQTVAKLLKEELGSYANINPKKYQNFLNSVLLPMAIQDDKLNMPSKTPQNAPESLF